MMVPDELTFGLGDANLLAVEFADYFGAPVFRKELELSGNIDFFHVRTPVA
jgi:hypothetical protein